MITLPADLTLHRATGIDELDTRTFYRLAQLRERVFIVEQECAYLELDGRDLEADAVQLWCATPAGEIAATVRVLSGRVLDADHPFARVPVQHDPPETHLRVIGRVVTAPQWRGSGLASILMRAAVEECTGSPIELDAQSHLTEWYRRFGFAPNGPEYLEDGIPHTPMRRDATPSPMSPLP